MTSNIEKLIQIAPHLEGRKIYAVGEDAHGLYEMFGLFRSLEIDNRCAMAYFHVTKLEKGFMALNAEGSWENTWKTIGEAELGFPVSQLVNLEYRGGNRMITMQFYPHNTQEETTLIFKRQI